MHLRIAVHNCHRGERKNDDDARKRDPFERNSSVIGSGVGHAIRLASARRSLDEHG